MDKVSVVIPTHNRKDLLVNTLNSVMNQTHKNLEIIVIDDASKDDTEGTVKSINNPRIKYLRNETSKGANVARNMGIKSSTGEYIAFLDDDDTWMPEKIEKQLKVFKSNSKIGLVYTGAKLIYENYNLFYYNIPSRQGDLSKAILVNNLIGSTSSVMIKKEVLSKSGIFDEELPAIQDYDLWIRICQVSEIGFVKEPMLNYYIRSNVTQISKSLDKHRTAINCINNKYRDLIDKLDESQKKSRQVADLLAIALKAKLNKDTGLSRKYILKSILIKPKLKSVVQYVFTFVDSKWLIILRAKFAGYKK